MHYLLHLEYNGRRYAGWQHQNNGLAVSDVVLDTVRTAFGEVTEFHGCSRTDSGVHAYDFCVSFFLEKEMSDDVFCRALNVRLPADIRVVQCEHVADDFHARYSVKEKEYIYKILTGNRDAVFMDGLALMYPHPLDLDRLNREAAVLCGTHDFAAFMASGSKITDCTRTITHAYFTKDGDVVTFHVAADGFLYNMVRILVGTLLAIGEGKIKDMQTVLDNRDRRLAGRTAPACGLYLNKVTY